MDITERNAKNFGHRNCDEISSSFSRHRFWGRFRWFLAGMLILGLQVGCRNGQRLFPNLRLGSLPRIPAPSTGTLRFPGLSSTGTAPLSPPPNHINVNPPPTNDGTPQSGVFFQTPNQPYSSNTGASNGTQPLNSIPNRAGGALSARSLGGPGAGVSNNAQNFSGGNPANIAVVNHTTPNSGGSTFDPFRTGLNPNWANNSISAPLFNPNASRATSGGNIPAVSQPNAQKAGWYAGDQTVVGGSGGNGNGTGFFPTGQNSQPNQQLAIGNGGLIQRMNNSVKNFFNRQPANLGGFQTTAPVNNPAIGIQQNYPVAPAGYRQAVPGYYPQRQIPAGQVPVIQGGRTVYTNPNQVLGENSTSLLAENQARLGLRSNVAAGNSNYSANSGTVSGNVFPTGRAPISTAANINSGVNSEWVPVNAIR